jgi:hypothetical protein
MRGNSWCAEMAQGAASAAAAPPPPTAAILRNEILRQVDTRKGKGWGLAHFVNVRGDPGAPDRAIIVDFYRLGVEKVQFRLAPPADADSPEGQMYHLMVNGGTMRVATPKWFLLFPSAVADGAVMRLAEHVSSLLE